MLYIACVYMLFLLCVVVHALEVRALTSMQKVFGLIQADTKSFDFTPFL